MNDLHLTSKELKRLQQLFELDLLTGCWLWKGSLNQHGYAWFHFRGRTVRAHRLAYEYWNGKIPEGKQIDHLCRNRNCINPSHLDVVSPLENTQRGLWRKRTHCPQGHEYTPENTYIKPDGVQRCVICHRVEVKFYQRKKKLGDTLEHA